MVTCVWSPWPTQWKEKSNSLKLSSDLLLCSVTLMSAPKCVLATLCAGQHTHVHTNTHTQTPLLTALPMQQLVGQEEAGRQASDPGIPKRDWWNCCAFFQQETLLHPATVHRLWGSTAMRSSAPSQESSLTEVQQLWLPLWLGQLRHWGGQLRQVSNPSGRRLEFREEQRNKTSYEAHA